VLLAPPFIVEPSQVDTIVERLGQALEVALAGLDSRAKAARPP
jgi:adenosylmethionine-8-amino-7-oxononanoate aminotransferase